MRKILFILSSTSPFGGSTKSAEVILNKFQDDNEYNIGIVLPSKTGVYSEWINKGWRVYCIKMRHANTPPHQQVKDIILFPIRKIIHWIINAYAYHLLKKLILQESYDIVHTNVGVLDVGYRAAKAIGIPHVYHLREYQDLDFGEPIYPSHEKFNELLKARFNYTITITKDIYRYFDCNDNSAEVIYDGIIEQRQDIDSNKDKYFLFVGRLSDSKGTKDVIKAFGAIHNTIPDYRLILAGAPINEIYQKELCHLVNELGLNNKVEFLGPINYCSKLMRKAKCLIMASKSEGLGRVTIEAMAEGCLVVGYNTMGTKEQFDNGLAICGHEIGLRYNNQEELKVLMQQIAINKIDKYAETISYAQDVVFSLYTITSCYEKISNVYNKLLNENK